MLNSAEKELVHRSPGTRRTYRTIWVEGDVGSKGGGTDQGGVREVGGGVVREPAE